MFSGGTGVQCFKNFGKTEYFTMDLSVNEAIWSLAIEILDCLSLTHCFLNLFDHRIFGGKGTARNSCSYLDGI